MSHVDDELAQALAESEATARAEEPLPVTRSAPLSSGTTKRSIGLLVALLAMGGGILTLVMTSFETAAVYSRGVDELVKEKQKLNGRNVRVEGTLVKGTLKRRDEPCEYRFDIEKKGVVLPVRYAQCIVPDTFRDIEGMDVAVTAEGSLTGAGAFEATMIMAKCPSKYEMQDRARKGEQMPHSAPVQAGAVQAATY
jgi:cytochrome c-type biogenesis protein CcmE